MTTSIRTPSNDSPVVATDRLRIRMDDGTRSGPLDGAWWPRSRDLQKEVADLVDHFPPETGHITRLLFTRPDWDGQTATMSDHKVRCARGLVNVGSFPHDDTHRMVLALSSGAETTLMVIPPETEPETALLLMRQASDEHNATSATDLLAAVDPDLLPLRLQVWDDEGGHTG